MRFYIVLILFILTVIATVAVTGWVFYLLCRRYFDNEQKVRLLQLSAERKVEMTKVAAPLRLQAYERMALFLERISPDSLILRCYQPGMDMKLLQGVLTKNIRDEWEHNLSQQVYVSDEAWRRIRAAKEEMINRVNSAAVTLESNADPATLAAAVFAAQANGGLVDEALAFIRNECEQLLSD